MGQQKKEMIKELQQTSPGGTKLSKYTTITVTMHDKVRFNKIRDKCNQRAERLVNVKNALSIGNMFTNMVSFVEQHEKQFLKDNFLADTEDYD